MPELPEVETIARTVEKHLLNRKVIACTFYRKNLRETFDQKKICEVLQGQNVEAVHRRGKYMLLESKKGFVFFHFGMSGNIFYKQEQKPQKNHTHFILQSDAKQFPYLHYVDPRRFGRIGAILGKELESHPFFAKLGVEPLVGDSKTLAKHFFEAAQKRNVCVKTLLMNNEIAVGIGNIYACESLFLSGISPLRRCKSIALDEFLKIANFVRSILRKAIRLGGSTIKDFKKPDGNEGYFSMHFKVYGKEGENCDSCKTKIVQVPICGRSSWYCPKCQK